MSKDKSPDISITLSPTQVDSVLRSAAKDQTPSVAAVVSKSFAAARTANGSAHMFLTETSDPRLSRSLLRGLSLLTCFDDEGQARGIVEMADDLEMSPSTAHRYALTLVHLGLLERAPDTRKYSLPRLDAS